MKWLPLICFHLLMFTALSAQRKDLTYVENLVRNGKFFEAGTILKRELSKENSPEGLIELYDLRGNVSKLEGNIDQALFWWTKGDKIRTRVYSRQDYRMAWKYAHLTSYHYEKMHVVMSGIYLDSCTNLIKGLNSDQQAQIAIYNIWNILAQSTKLQSKNFDPGTRRFLSIYTLAESFLQQSINYQKTRKTTTHDLAKTYHLLANLHNDQAVLLFEKKNFSSEITLHRKIAHESYDRAASIWRKLYGDVHYELGKTLFVKSLLDFYISKHSDELNRSFARALAAFGAKNTGEANRADVPNYNDFLMCSKYACLTLLSDSTKPENLYKAIRINNQAVQFWEQIQQKSSQHKMNMQLSLYELIPHTERLSIALRLYRNRPEQLAEAFFYNSQHLKYVDIAKRHKVRKALSISELQSRLGDRQLFLDFNYDRLNGKLYVLRISKTNFELNELPSQVSSAAIDLNNSIAESDFSKYTKTSRNLFKMLFPKGLPKQNELIISSDKPLRNLPFDVLLTTDKGVSSADFRKLDYLIKKVKTSYVLSPVIFTNRQVSLKGNIAVCIPEIQSEKYSRLPFSSRFGQWSMSTLNAELNEKKRANRAGFLSSGNEIVHLSTHGIVGNEGPLNKLILFNSFLRQEDVYSANRVPKLIVLNTCNSALGNPNGDGTDGFVRAYHSQGAQASISNIWEVDDQMSNELFKSFYLNLWQGKSSGKSLHDAKLEVLENAPTSEAASPYYWAGHVFTGNENITLKKETPASRWYWIAGVFVCLVVGGILRKSSIN